MQDLSVTGVEGSTLLLTSDDGALFRVVVDEVTLAKLRQSSATAGTGRKLAPKEIQAHIRSGMSGEDVAAITGASLEYVQKFEGPVLAEREYVVNSALNVAVHTAAETDPLNGGSTFGTVIRERLYDLSAINERWASWKEVGGGWIVKLAFTANSIDHDARWGFEPRKSALFPLNSEAIALSQQGEMTAPLVPRLRAVSDLERQPDQSRFDSGAFTENELARPAAQPDTMQYGRLEDAPAAVSEAAINRAPVVNEIESNQTADLLEALRRRRGEREMALFADEDDLADEQAPGSMRIVDKPEGPNEFLGRRSGLANKAPAENHDKPGNTSPQPTVLHPRGASGKKSRATMPSWDEIVFGARSDDEN
jgi:hypothetical protein